MSHLLMVILDNIKCLPELLRAWQGIGVSGATILESVGAYRAHTWLDRVGLGALERLFEADEIRRRTVLAAIDDEALLARAIAEAERVVGGFENPNSGVLLTLPIGEARGLHKVMRPPAASEPNSLYPSSMAWRTLRMGDVAQEIGLEAVVVGPETPLDEVARALAAQPGARVACVVADGRLVGLLDVRCLAEDLVLYILPEESLKEVTDMQRMMDFAAKVGIRNAGTAMQKPVWVMLEDSLAQALIAMYENRLSGLPVVDALYHVVGYVDLLGLLAYCLGRLERERP